MEIKAVDVKKLRDKTGAGMLDCKKALKEAEGDFSKAEKYLKELGLAAAAKRSGRATNEGRIFTKIGDSIATVLELACETDFVARNKDFIALGEDIADTILAKGLTEKTPELDEKVKDTISTIKENMELRRFTTMPIAEKELVSAYTHGEGTIGVLVKFEADSPSVLENDAVKEFAFDCALHIAAFNPLFLDRNSVNAAYKEEQEAIFRKQAENLGKPEKVIDGIVKGKMNKHFAENCLLDQGFVKEEKLSVAKKMEEIAKQAGGSLKLTNFVYYKVGEES
ncbi:MAG: translation elongation factor Ts [Spirochaetia bacterium]|nr:translation elongation factor Ts [Spirochaetia bacterium]